MVLEYGMGKTLGLSTYPKQHRPLFLSPEQAPLVSREYSEATAAKLDEEVKSILEEQEQLVRKLLTEKKNILETIARKLLQTEVMDAEEFYRLIGQGPATG
jgi:cell division protease FtsH